MFYCRANWMIISSGRIKGKVSIRTSWWVHKNFNLLVQIILWDLRFYVLSVCKLTVFLFTLFCLGGPLQVPGSHEQLGICPRVAEDVYYFGTRCKDSAVLCNYYWFWLFLYRLYFKWYVQIQKAAKKSARREQLQREEAEQKKLKTVLELQFILDRLGDDTVRQDLKQGVGSSPLLTDSDLAAFDEFYKLVGPDRDQNMRLVHIFMCKPVRNISYFMPIWSMIKKVWQILIYAGWLISMKKRLCTLGSCWKGRTSQWLEQHVSLL